MNNVFKKTALNIALTTALGVSTMGVSSVAQADTIVDFSFDGLFTMLTSTGTALQNTSYPFYGDTTWDYGMRTQIAGTMQFNLDTGEGSGTVVPFAFFDGGNAVAAGITMQAIGDGQGGAGSLVLGNMLFNWNGNNGIPVSIVLDAQGMFAALPGLAMGLAIDGTSGALPASDGIKKGNLPIGTVPVATAGWDTTNVAGCTLTDPEVPGSGCMGVAQSGTFPLIADAIGGSPMADGPFAGFNANFDVTDMVVTGITVTSIPVPAAVWLFGSGLLGLVGVARRKKA